MPNVLFGGLQANYIINKGQYVMSSHYLNHLIFKN